MVSEELPVQPSPAPPARVRRAPQPRAGPELPDRLQHPRRDRAGRRAVGRRRRARDRRRPRRAVRVPGAARAHVHVVEIDRGAGARRCATRSTRSPTRRCTSADALELDLGALSPAPDKVVANLPYGIAASAILRTIEELPGCDAVGGDGAARGGRAAGRRAGQRPTACRRCSRSSRATCASLRPVSRNVFHPVPNVDSVLVGLDRRGPEPAAGAARARARRVRAPAQGARRLAGAGAGRGRRRARARARGARGDGPAGRRPRRAARAGGVRRAGGGCGRHDRAAHALAPGKVNLVPVSRGTPATDGLHELVSLVQAVSLGDDAHA